MQRKFRLFFFVALVGMGLEGCASSHAYMAKNFTVVGKTALLPMANNTTDLDGPPYIRRLLSEGFPNRGFTILPLQAVDDQLKAHGFTDGGQLGAATPQKLGEWTGADLLIYPVLETFSYVNVGYYWQRSVKITARLVDAKTGERLWEGEGAFSTRWLVTNQQQATEEFTVQLAAKAVEKMTHVPLQLESRNAVGRLLAELPRR